MSDTLPIFNEVDEVIGTLTVIERHGRNKIVFRTDDGMMIDMPNITRFIEYARNRELPQEQINRALRFFQKHLTVY